MRYFETQFLEEAKEFIDELDLKTIKKYFITLTLQNKRMIHGFLRSCKMIFGSFVQSSQDYKFDFLHFGINQGAKKLWL